MTIDEAIVHAREKAKEMYLQGMLCHANPNDDKLDRCIECGREHEQLAEWLEELKKRRSEDYGYMADIHQSIGYRKAIDDFVKALCIEYAPASDEMQNEYDNVCLRFEKIAEKLKAGGNNGTVSEKYNGSWNPIEEKLPPDDNFILISFSNFSVPIVGRYEEDEDGGGNFFAGDEDEPLISQDMYVNAWMPLPKPYEEIQYTANNK